MTEYLWEHWSTMSDKEILGEIFAMIGITILIGIILGIIQYLKNKYNDKVQASNSKILKFIFKYIL